MSELAVQLGVSPGQLILGLLSGCFVVVATLLRGRERRAIFRRNEALARENEQLRLRTERDSRRDPGTDARDGERSPHRRLARFLVLSAAWLGAIVVVLSAFAALAEG